MDWVEEFTAQKLADSCVEEGTFNGKLSDAISGGHLDEAIKAVQVLKSMGFNNSSIDWFMKMADSRIGLAKDGTGVCSLVCGFILDHWEDEEIKQRRGGE